MTHRSTLCDVAKNSSGIASRKIAQDQRRRSWLQITIPGAAMVPKIPLTVPGRSDKHFGDVDDP